MADGRMNTPAELISRGNQAATELERTTEAFAVVRQRLLEAIAATSMDQSEARERLYLSVCLLEPVRAALIEAVNNGIAAAHAQHIEAIMHSGAERAN